MKGTAETGEAHWPTFNAALLKMKWYGNAVLSSRGVVTVVTVVIWPGAKVASRTSAKPRFPPTVGPRLALGAEALGDGVSTLGDGVSTLAEVVVALGEVVVALGEVVVALGEVPAALAEVVAALGEVVAALAEVVARLREVVLARCGVDDGVSVALGGVDTGVTCAFGNRAATSDWLNSGEILAISPCSGSIPTVKPLSRLIAQPTRNPETASPDVIPSPSTFSE
nr:hypothetical protein [Nocardia xishanensis]